MSWFIKEVAENDFSKKVFRALVEEQTLLALLYIESVLPTHRVFKHVYTFLHHLNVPNMQQKKSPPPNR
jgi:hypothetical protein